MRDIYLWFLGTGGIIVVLGAFTAAFGIAPREMDRVGVLARVIGSLTAAGLLGFAFVVDKLADPEVDLVAFFRSGENSGAIAMVILLISAGATGLLAAATVAIFGPPTTMNHPHLARAFRWAGGCLATATVAVILLFPATIVLILQAGDAPRGS